MSALRRLVLALVLITVNAGAAWAGPGAHGPNGEHLDGPAAAAGTGLMRLPDGSVNVPKLAQRRMDLRTLIAPVAKASATLELNGRVAIDPNAGGRVQAVHGGVVEAGPQGLPVAGQAVRKGQVLAYLRHHAEPFAEAGQKAQWAELRANREIAQQRLKRLEALEGTTPRKDIEAARSDLAGLQARERSIGASLTAREAITASATGVIARAEVLEGQVVEARELLFDVVDPKQFLIEASLSDPRMAGRIGAARLAGLEGIALTPLGSAHALRDGMLPLSFRARAESANAPALAVGQPVTVIAQLKETIEGIVLPAAAIVRSPSNEPAVWIKVGAERFVPQPVEVRPLDAARVVVVKGLAADNRVVVQGAALVNQVR
jgi:cobalt-zinc-cadmium efflux system membrane fusion protein